MSWFYKKINPELNVAKIETLASELKEAKTQSSWFGRKVVVAKNGKEKDLTQEVKAALKEIKSNIESLDTKARAHVFSVVTKLDKLYNQAGRVGWFNPTGKVAKEIKERLTQQELLNQCHQKCVNLSNQQTTEDNPCRMIQILKQLATCKNPDKLKELKKDAIYLTYGAIENPELLNNLRFVDELWEKIKDTLCLQKHPFFEALSKEPKVILSEVGEQARSVHRELAGLSRSPTPMNIDLGEDTKVQVPGDFKDSIHRSVDVQIKNMATSYDQLHPSIKAKLPKERIEKLSHEELGGVFLADLREKLGKERECLIEPILVAVEQSCCNYMFGRLSTEMNEQFKGEIFQTPEDPAVRVVKIKIPQDVNLPVEASVTCEFPMRIKDLSSEALEKGILRKFTPAEIQSTLTLEFNVPKGSTAGLNPSDYCSKVSLEFKKLETPLDERQYLIS